MLIGKIEVISAALSYIYSIDSLTQPMTEASLNFPFYTGIFPSCAYTNVVYSLSWVAQLKAVQNQNTLQSTPSTDSVKSLLMNQLFYSQQIGLSKTKVIFYMHTFAHMIRVARWPVLHRPGRCFTANQQRPVQWRTQKIFMGGIWFRVVWWSFVFGVLFVTSQFDVISMFPNQRFGEVC